MTRFGVLGRKADCELIRSVAKCLARRLKRRWGCLIPDFDTAL